MRRDALALGMIGAGLCCPSLAFAQASPTLPRLEVARGPGADDCPETTALAARVEQVLGRPGLATTSAATDTTYRVTFTRDARTYGATLQVSGKRQGERVLADESKSCAGLSEALVAMLAIAVDPRTQTFTLEVPSPPPPPEGDISPDDIEPSRVLAAPSPSSSPTRLDVTAGAALTRGVLPETAGGVRAELRVRRRAPVGLGVGLLYLPEQTRPHPPGTIGVALAVASLSGCYLPLDRPTLPRVALCFEPLAGALRGTGRGFDTAPRSVTRPWIALSGALRVDGDLVGPLGWTLGAALVAPLTRERLAVTGLGLVHDPSPVAFVGALGLRLALR